MVNFNKNKVLGLMITVFSSYWIWDNLHLIYLYNYTGILFLFMHPNWTLIFNAVLGLLGIGIGVQVLQAKIRFKLGFSISILIPVIGKIIQFVF